MNFKGGLYLTNDANLCIQLSMNPNIKIINLDEDNTVPQLNPETNRGVFMGTILCPSVETTWKEIDGDSTGFAASYYDDLMQPDVIDYIMALIGYMYTRGDLVIFYPDLSVSAIQFLYEFFWSQYGFHISLTPQNPLQDVFRFDPNKTDIYLIGLYSLKIIDAYVLLREWPLNKPITDQLMSQLHFEINPYMHNGNFKDAYDSIMNLCVSLHNNPNMRIPVHFNR